MRKTIRAAVMVLAIAVAGPVVAGQFEDGEALFLQKQKDYAATLRFLRPMADRGNTVAAVFLGHMYSLGRDAPLDYVEAVKWYRMAAEKGNADGQSMLGFMYSLGQGVPLNDGLAAKWVRLAADQGLATAQGSLGLKYAGGKGVPLDYALAYMWLNLAAAGGYTDAATWRDGLARKMTPTQIAEAQRLSRKWKPVTRPTTK